MSTTNVCGFKLQLLNWVVTALNMPFIDDKDFNTRVIFIALIIAIAENPARNYRR